MAGYTGQEDSPIQGEELLKYTQGAVKLSKTILATTVDPNHDEDEKILYPGLILGQITASGKYTHLILASGDGSQNEETSVMLYTRIKMDGVTDSIANCLVEGYVNTQMARFHTPANSTAFSWTASPFKQ